MGMQNRWMSTFTCGIYPCKPNWSGDTLHLTSGMPFPSVAAGQACPFPAVDDIILACFGVLIQCINTGMAKNE